MRGTLFFAVGTQTAQLLVNSGSDKVVSGGHTENERKCCNSSCQSVGGEEFGLMAQI